MPGVLHASVEKDLEVATKLTCEVLQYDAITLYGSVAEIEYAVSFALEELNAIEEAKRSSDPDTNLSLEQRSLQIKISRLIAMHRLFQKPGCPIDRDWYSYKPTEVGINSRWD